MNYTAALCRRIAGEIWEADGKDNKRFGSIHTRNWDKEAFVTDLAMLLKHTSLLKMIRVLEEANAVPRKDENLRRWGERIRELTYDVLTEKEVIK